jgi:hypothetical protein
MFQGVLEHVYHVEAMGSDNFYNPVAIRPTIKNGVIEWEDTSRGEHKKIAKIDVSNDSIRIKTVEGEEILLTLLTLKRFIDKVEPLVEGTVSFNSDKELQDYYLNTNFSSY